MNDAGNEVAQERKPVDALSASDEPGRRRIGEGGLNLKPSGRVPAPTSLEQRSGGDQAVGQFSVEDAVFSCRDVNVFYGSKHALKNVNIDVGRKQVRIMDHTVSTHVMMALSFSGKLKDVAGVEVDRTRMQDLWNAEDADMRFSIQDATNVEGQRFALSPLGKKYFVTAILKLTGIVNRRIDEVAGMLPKQVDAYADQVRPLLEEFKSGRG